MELKYLKQAFYESSCVTTRTTVSDPIVIADVIFNISDWFNVVTPSLLESLDHAKSISLNISVETLSLEVCDLLANTIGSRVNEIVLTSCFAFDWNREGKRLLAKTAALQSIVFKNCRWVTDTVIEQISKRYGSTLVVASFHGLSLTNNALFQLGRRCKNLTVVRIDCCPKISDLGILEICKKNSLKVIKISHSVQISDKSLESIFLNSKELVFLCIINSEKVTDTGIGYLHEITTTSGTKKTVASKSLQYLSLNDCTHITSQSLLWLSASAINVKELIIEGCEDISFSRCVDELSNFKSLVSLKFGPSQLPVSGVGFINNRSSFFANLVKMDLCGIKGLLDEHISRIVEMCVSINDLALVDMPFGTATIETLCSFLPSIEKLRLEGSPILRDIDFRCLCSVCLHLKHLTIGNCSQLSDAGFTRLVSLRHLKQFTYINSSTKCSGAILKFLSLSPLHELHIGGLSISQEDTLLGLKEGVFYNMNLLSFTNCKGLHSRFITQALNHFISCKCIDFTGSDISPDDLSEYVHFNPYLRFSFTSEFLGFKLLGESKSTYVQFWAKILVLRKHYGAKLLQRLRRKYLQRLEMSKLLRREQWTAFKISQLVLIQSMFRGYQARLRLAKLKLSGTIISRCLATFYYRRCFLKVIMVKRHYRWNLLKRAFGSFVGELSKSSKYIRLKAEKVELIRQNFLKRALFKIMLNMNAFLRNKAMEDSALIMWEINILKTIFRSWKGISYQTAKRKLQLTSFFMVCLPMETWNSSKSKQKLGVGTSFRNKRLLLIAWLTLAKDRLESRRIEQLVPVALEHFKSSFFGRVVRNVFKGIEKYRKFKIKKRLDLQTAKHFTQQYHILRSYFGLLEFTAIKRSHRMLMMNAVKFREKHVIISCVHKRWIPFTYRCYQEKYTVKNALLFRGGYLLRWGYFQFLTGLFEQRRWRKLVGKAFEMRRLHYWKMGFRGWDEFKKYNKNMDVLYYQRYLKKLCKKCLYGFRLNVALNKESIRSVTMELERRAGSSIKFFNAVNIIVKFQAICRGRKQFRKFAEDRIQKLYSIQTLQNFFRIILARKEYASRLRKRDIAGKVLEDHELDLMRDAELEMRYFMYKESAIVDIQRVYRGWLGRNYAKEVAIEHFREKSKDYYLSNEHFRVHHEEFKRAAIARELALHRAATQIEKIVRGRIGRKRFKEVEQQAKVAKYAVHLQRAYRKRLAYLKLEALRRDKLSELRYKAARRQRGLLLRILGLKKRKQQFQVSPILEGMGMDPITYNYRYTELMTETIQDFKHLIGIYKREKALYEVHGTNKLNLVIGRRNVLAEQGWKFNIQDAVRIVEPGHKFEGYTGTVVRIDESLLGAPLFEVRLDRFPRQTFVRMTTDPTLIYTKTQALAKIMKRPELTEEMDKFRLFGVEREENVTKKTIYAAWTIQRAYRVHRSRKIVARKRYEHWMQNIARQWSLLFHLSDTNSLNTQGYNFAYLLNARSLKPIFYDEIRHKLLPGRFTAQVNKPNEKNVIRKELDLRYKDRLKYLQKSALIAGKEPFSVGYERMTVKRKIGLLVNSTLGIFKKGKTGVKDLFGTKGAKFLSSQGSMVTGSDRYCFQQFRNSAHVRYYKASLYQGEWSGIPLFTPLKPNGEGMIVFLDAWGFAKEDKVLYLTIVRCRHLNAMDLSTSDPYCDIYCNGMNLQTSIKWRNLNPEYHESFEIDVTNPLATLNIQLKDKDYLGSDDFMGQINLNLSDFADGKQHQMVLLLKGEDLTVAEDFDRGEVEIRLRWAERIFEDDQARIEQQRLMVIKIQSWARRIASLMMLKVLKQERVEKLKIVRQSAVKITNTCRIRLARKELKRRRRNVHAAIKLQKRVRIWIAKRVFKAKKIRSRMAIRIQTKARVYLAKVFVKNLRDKIAADLNRNVTVIQKYARRMIAIKWYNLQIKEIEKARAVKKHAAAMNGIPYEEMRVKDWIQTYGVDPDYGLKRNRRITEKLFAKMLKMRFIRVISKFGIVYVDSYPPVKSEDEQQQGPGSAQEALTNRDDFVSVYLPTFQPIAVRRVKAIESFNKYNHTAILHLPSSVYMRESVHYLVCIIQCAQRQRVARMGYQKMLRVHKAIALFQKIFRRRYERLHRASVVITSIFRRIKAKKSTLHLRIERNAVMTIQNSYRCYRARSLMFDFRSVDKLSVLKATPSLLYNEPEKCLEHRSDTFWIAESPDKAEIRVEFAKLENIVDIWIMTSTFSASPNFLSISAVADKKSGYKELVDKAELPFLVGDRWHHFPLKVISTKYFMLTFFGNYGDDKYISIRQIRFIRSKESSAKIVRQPLHYILDPGPTIGEESELELQCEATGWPLPTYQWYHNGELLIGKTSPTCNVKLFCSTFGQRTYRCIKCKMVSKTVPVNAFHVKCGNCGYRFTYKEVDDYDKPIAALKQEEEDLHKTKNSLVSSKIQMESFNNPKYKSILQDLGERLQVIEEKLQSLREARFHRKKTVSNCNHFSNEGIYTCVVKNIRGGSLVIKRVSVAAVVVVEKPNPFTVEVMPYYMPRQQVKRKKWNIYASIFGTFRQGRLDGIVTIRFNDGSFYEGPYIGEEVLDFVGKTKSESRPPNHYGIFRLADGRVFEGANVDNHFDQNNLQSFYRLTLPNSERYEGSFCDEMFHGTGMFTYKDGSVYEGQWHRGTRFGHGHFRSAEKWTYEGFFDKDRRHRQGVIDWPDGACYMGDWYYDKIQGKGIFITPLRDVYKGELVEGKFEGYGELVYADGSTYVGEFKGGLRHGKGVFIDRDGTESFGHFKEDLRTGEHVVKVIIPIEELGQDNYEVRIGVYENGHLSKWKSKFSNPIASKQFIALFRQNREMFDSVYSMILAKNLPSLPEGIDANNPDVKAIVFKIRTEAGMLVGQHALNQAKAQLDALLQPLADKIAEVDNLKKEIENYSMKIISLEKESREYHSRFTNLMSRFEKETSKIEQHWLDEPTQVRALFYAACKKLDTITVDEFFAFRNHRVVPIFVKKIFDALSYLLNLPIDWSVQQMVIADSLANSRGGDEEALRLNYKCKLSYLMKDYQVYDYVRIKEHGELAKILADVRFRSDSYYIESTGPPGPVLVEWIKSNYAYIKAAEKVYTILNAAEEKKLEGFRVKSTYTKKKEEIFELGQKLEDCRTILAKTQLELEDIQHAILKANDLVQFISGRYNFGQTVAKQDYYKLLEQKMEQKKDRFTVEVCIRSMTDKVIERIDKERKTAMLQSYATGKIVEEQSLQQVSLFEWIKDEVRSQQQSIVDSGRTLGYSFEPESTDVTYEYTTQLISLIVDIVMGKMNDKLNDLASARSWTSRRGRRFNCRFLFIMAWKVWQEEGINRRNIFANQAWEGIFGEATTCAIMAVEARVSNRMSSIARAQGKVWEFSHPEEIKQAEIFLSGEFAKDYETVNEAAISAINIEEDQTDTISPSIRARAACFIKLHPDEVREARDEKNIKFSEEFESNFGSESNLVCFKILNGLANEDEMEWSDYAHHWKDFHIEQYEAAAESILNELSKDFVDAYPLSTFYEAAKMIENNSIAKYIVDEEIKVEFVANPKHLINAFCWGVKNQGLLRKGKENLAAEHKNDFGRMWNDLELQTENFGKGSSLMIVHDDNGQDRFLGFRNRLANKFAWVYGYLSYRQECICKQIDDLTTNDPIYKIHHRVRPSKFDRHAQSVEENYLSARKSLEEDLSTVLSKLSQWNTYFGWT